MTFDERRLQILVAIADTGSLGRASEIVNLSQPALSRLLHELELRLGYQLFERHSKGMLPTPAGDVLVRHARQLVFDMEQARGALAELQGVKRGQVRVGAVASAISSIVSTAISAVAHKAPQLRFEVFEAPDGELADALANRKIDLMVGSDHVTHDGIRALGRCGVGDHFTVCCSRQHPLASASVVSLADALSQRWIMLREGRTPRVNFDNLLMKACVPRPDISIETNSISSQIALTQSTDLLCWLPVTVMRDQLADGSLKILDIPELTMTRHFCIYRREMGQLPRSAELLLTHLQQDSR